MVHIAVLDYSTVGDWMHIRMARTVHRGGSPAKSAYPQMQNNHDIDSRMDSLHTQTGLSFTSQTGDSLFTILEHISLSF